MEVVNSLTFAYLEISFANGKSKWNLHHQNTQLHITSGQEYSCGRLCHVTCLPVWQVQAMWSRMVLCKKMFVDVFVTVVITFFNPFLSSFCCEKKEKLDRLAFSAIKYGLIFVYSVCATEQTIRYKTLLLKHFSALWFVANGDSKRCCLSIRHQSGQFWNACTTCDRAFNFCLPSDWHWKPKYYLERSLQFTFNKSTYTRLVRGCDVLKRNAHIALEHEHHTTWSQVKLGR